MSIVAQKMSACEFMDLPEDPDRVRYELADGEIIVSPSPSFDHAYAVTRLLGILLSHIDQRQLGVIVSDIDTYFGPRDVRRPDLLYFAHGHLRLTPGGKPSAPPDLCIEVLSPSNSRDDRITKYRLYEASGVGSYWIVNPTARTVEAYALRGGAYVEAGVGHDQDSVSLSPFNDLRIPLSQLWWAPSTPTG